ncbi:MAG: CHAT domain-containing protein, partial [Cyanobacteriota bacterium]|nr:CHAT domain-containing protein [Cyanobacteriota bacterium]
MNKLVILSLAQGSLEYGFTVVTAQLWMEGVEKINQPIIRRFQSLRKKQISSAVTPSSMKFLGSLPPAPELEFLYRQWQLLYNALSQRLGWSVRIRIEHEEILQVSEVDFHRICLELKAQLNTWLNSQPFRRIDQQLRRYLSPQDEIQIIIETDQDQLRRLPWHLWDFFEDYPQAELALSTVESVGIPSPTQPGQVRILAVLGNSFGVDIEADRQLLETLPDVEIVFLKEPRRQELDEHLWDRQGWDILFFAGHSHTDGDTGLLHINPTDTITIPQLKNALKTSIARGLQLAIFNSCDGLGLARQLEDLNIGQIIVMREPVADAVAQAFLKYFLATFARRGWRQIPLHQAVQEARQKLQPLEDEFPCASWMPVLCQNSASEPL